MDLHLLRHLHLARTHSSGLQGELVFLSLHGTLFARRQDTSQPAMADMGHLDWHTFTPHLSWDVADAQILDVKLPEVGQQPQLSR